MGSTRKRSGGIINQVSIAAVIVVVLAAGGIGYAVYRHHTQSASKGGWTYLGVATDSATELGGKSSMATYACVDKVSKKSWTVKAKAVLSPVPATPGDYAFTLSDWPYKSLADAPGGQSESPRTQAKSNTWSGNLTTVQINVDPSKSNYVEVTAGSKGHGGKILPTPVNNLPSASTLAEC